MKNLRYIFMLMAIAFAAASCTEEAVGPLKGDDDPVETPPPPPPPLDPEGGG